MLSKMPIVVKSPPTIAHVLMRKARIGLRFCCVSVPSGEKSYLTVSGSPCTALFTAPLPNRHRHKRTKGSPIGKRASACFIYASRTEAGGRRGGSTGKRHAQRHTPVAHDRCRRPAVGRLSYGGPDRPVSMVATSGPPFVRRPSLTGQHGRYGRFEKTNWPVRMKG
jgi:hypothetical protein